VTTSESGIEPGIPVRDDLVHGAGAGHVEVEAFSSNSIRPLMPNTGVEGAVAVRAVRARRLITNDLTEVTS
jgi:hypothetical protein